ncbi:MAG: hypothetical protein J7K65_05060 [Planctomycetes bacterium]|nr:hypothetical protein [Planctomycetota bacterium]
MSKKKPKIKDHQLEGFKYFKAISKMLEGLHHAGCDRDIAGNRILHMDQYVSLVLLYMFNPICTSLRSLQQISKLKKSKSNSVPLAPRWEVSPKRRLYSTATFSCPKNGLRITEYCFGENTLSETPAMGDIFSFQKVSLQL